MIVLSLFDGMACGYEALKRAGIPVTKYYASEIDPHAIKIAKKNHPDIVHLGDVENWYMWDIERPNLIIGGSPCQGFSFAGRQLAFDDPRSKLFFDYVHIRDHFQPDFFLLENVRMKKEHLAVITDYMGVDPHFINSALVSAQNRQRFYWYNWQAPDPQDKGLLLKDVIESGEVDRDKSYCLDANYYKGGSLKNYLEKRRKQIVFSQSENRLMVRELSERQLKGAKSLDDKAECLTASGSRCGGNGTTFVPIDEYSPRCQAQIRKNAKTEDEKAVAVCTNSNMTGSGVNVLRKGPTYRKLSCVECERLQTLPDNYTGGVSNTQRYKMLGNGWTVDVIAHLFRFLPHDLV